MMLFLVFVLGVALGIIAVFAWAVNLPEDF
jgi:hypothetical protein